jgi:phosphoribosylglycinamide formyltransferase 1
MAALVEASLNPDYPATIKRVISNNPGAAALAFAKAHAIPAMVIDHREYADRPSHEAAVIKAIDADRPDFICLAGYMRILTPEFVRRYSGRMLNIHPSLLPSFRGVDTHVRALSEGVRLHGASVNFVTEKLDEGPLVAQVAVPVLAGDSAASLGARVLEQEHRLYPHALRLVASGAVRMSGGRAVFEQATDTVSEEQARASAVFSPGLPG